MITVGYVSSLIKAARRIVQDITKEKKGMSAFTAQINKGKIRLQVVLDGDTRSLEFTDKTGELVARGEEIPNSGHYDFKVTTIDGEYLGTVTMLYGIHYKDSSGKEIAWHPPGEEAGRKGLPGVKRVKTTKLPTRIVNNPELRILESVIKDKYGKPE